MTNPFLPSPEEIQAFGAGQTAEESNPFMPTAEELAPPAPAPKLPAMPVPQTVLPDLNQAAPTNPLMPTEMELNPFMPQGEELDQDEFDLSAGVINQLHKNFLRSGAAGLADIGRRAAQLFEADEGAVLKDADGNIVDAQVAPADRDLKREWKANLERQKEGTVEYASAEQADSILSALNKGDPRLVEMNAHGLANKWFKGDLLSTLGDFPSNLAETIDEATGGKLSGAAANFQDQWEDVAQLLGEEAAEDYKKADTSDGVLPTFDEVALGTAASLGSVVPSVAAAVSGKFLGGAGGAQLLGLSTMGIVSQAVKGQELAEQGIDILRTQQMQTIKAFTEPATEAIPLKHLMDGGQPLIKGLVNYLVTEVPSEILETTLDDLATWLIINPDQSAGEFLEEWGKHVVETAIIAPLAGGAQKMAVQTLDKTAQVLDKAADKLVDVGGTILPTKEFKAAKENALTETEFIAKKEEMANRLREELRVINQEAAGFNFDEALATEAPNVANMLSSEAAKFSVETRPIVVEETVNRAIDRIFEEVNVTSQDGTVGTLQGLALPEGSVVTVGDNVSRITLEKNKDILTPAEQKQYQKKADNHDKNTKLAQEVLKTLTKKYTPDTTYILNTGVTSGPLKITSASGKTMASLVIPHSPQAMDGKRVGIVSINPRSLKGTDRDTIVNSVVHEFGHALIARSFEGMAAQYPNAQKLVQKAYVEQLGKAVREGKIATGADYMFSPERAKQVKTQAGSRTVEETVSAIKNPDYVFGLEEFTAEHMIRAVAGKPVLKGPVKKILGAAAKELKTLHSDYVSGPFKANENFEQFVEGVLKYGQVKAIEQQTAMLRANQKAAIKEMVNLSPRWMGPKQLRNLTSDILQKGGMQAQEELLGIAGKGGKRVREMRTFEKKMESDQTEFTVVTKFMAGLMQIARKNPHIVSLQEYWKAVSAASVTKSRYVAAATEVMQEWQRHVGSRWKDTEHAARFDAALVEMDQRSEELGRKLSPDEITETATKHQLNENDIKLMTRIWGLYQVMLTDMEANLIARVARAHDNVGEVDLQAKEEEIANIRKDFERMRNRNYMPHARFGKYRITLKFKGDAKIDGIEYESGDKIYMGNDTLREHKKAHAELIKKAGSAEFEIQTDEISDDLMMFQGLQPEVAVRLGKAVNLTRDQMKSLQEFVVQNTPGQSIRKNMLKRKGVQGYSGDMQRVSADYFMRMSSHLARTKHDLELKDAIALGKHELSLMSSKNGGDVKMRKRRRLLQWVEKHYDYMNNPGQEYAQLRAAGFFWYLAYSPKSALVNMTQVPFVTAPYLSARFGWASTSAEMTKVMAQTGLHFQGKVTAKAKGKGAVSPFSDDVLEMMQELKARNILDEGMSTMLAGLANDQTLLGFRTSNVASQGLKAFAEKGAWMFQTAEKMNRYYTAITSYNLAKHSGMDNAAATDFAQQAVQDTQLEYARFNRPQLMRGKASPVFLFYSYISQMMYFVGNDPARWRYLMGMLLMGGYTAMPGMENFIDIMDGALTKFKGKMGMANPKTQIRIEIARWVNELTEDVNWLPETMSGLMADNAARVVEDGLLSNVGGYDLQSSISLGNALMFDTSAFSREMSGESRVGALAESAAGAPAEAILKLLYATFSDEPMNWKQAQKLGPVFAQNAAKGYRRFVEQEENYNPSSAPIKFDADSPYTMTSMLMEGSGFGRRDIRAEKEGRFLAKDAARYYANRESFLRTKFFTMMQKEGNGHKVTKEDWDSFDEELKGFNNGVKNLDPRLRLTQKELVDSWQNRMKSAREEEIFGHKQAKFQSLAEDIRSVNR